jgi:hypothetical protein
VELERDLQARPARSSRRLKGILALASLASLGVIACGNLLGLDPDPAPDGKPPVALPDAADFPEGSVVLVDGAVQLPDGAVVDGAPGDSATLTDAADAADAGDQYVPPGCPGIAACPRYVFVTSDTVTFDLAEPAAAAAHCNVLAAASGIAKVSSRMFEAWVSTTGSPASLRLVHGTMAYRDVLDMVIANNWTDLTDGLLKRSVFINEKGAAIAASLPVWTGTGADGMLLLPNCGDWLDSAPTAKATRGVVGATDVNWSAYVGFELTCPNTFARLYCIEK